MRFINKPGHAADTKRERVHMPECIGFVFNRIKKGKGVILKAWYFSGNYFCAVVEIFQRGEFMTELETKFRQQLLIGERGNSGLYFSWAHTLRFVFTKRTDEKTAATSASDALIILEVVFSSGEGGGGKRGQDLRV